MSRSEALLEKLIAHNTVSHATNLPLIEEVETHLKTLGFRTVRLSDATEPKAGL